MNVKALLHRNFLISCFIFLFFVTKSDTPDFRPVGSVDLCFDWEYDNTPFVLRVTLEVPRDFPKQKRIVHQGKFVPEMGPVVAGLDSITNFYSLSEADTRGMVKAFTQSFQYVKDKNFFRGYWKHPYQTLIDGGGDCEDTGLLACTIFKALSQPSILLKMPGLPGHVAVGVACSDCDSGVFTYDKQGNEYFYLETTHPSYEIGSFPVEIQNPKRSRWWNRKIKRLHIK